MHFGGSFFACALIGALALPGSAQARPVVEGRGAVAKKIHDEPRSVTRVDRGSRSAVRGTDPFIWPVVGAVNTHFGGDHAGIDIEGVTGDKIVAARDGVVTFAGDDGDGYGVKVIIEHADGYETLYSHLSSVAVSKGEIAQGELVGSVGCTGSCTGDHLHFEILRDGVVTNPLDLLP
jgi:murein DD-endopeptidase MepM/ murein hydrolase activator NlpD